MADVMQALVQSLPETQKTYDRNHAVLAQEVVGTFYLPYPFYAKESKGSRVADMDGNGCIDLTMAFGPLILGWI
jgi:glutamate-1-semialdehyde aminotransferase